MGVYPRSVPEYGLNVCKLLILYSFFVFAVGEEIFQCGGVWSNLTVAKCDCRNKHHFVCRFGECKQSRIWQCLLKDGW